MDQDRFEAEVVALAADGAQLTVANVAARTGLAPRRVEALQIVYVARFNANRERTRIFRGGGGGSDADARGGRRAGSMEILTEPRCSSRA